MPAAVPDSQKERMSLPLLPPLRPPGAASESAFSRLCVRCGKCVQACPHGSLKLMGGFGRSRLAPHIIPDQAPCELCMKCAQACPTGALDPGCDMRAAAMGRAYILTSACHNYTNGPMCWTCYDRCPLRGEAMTLAGGLTPAVGKACAGCGVCAYVCPQKAVLIVPASSDYIPPDAAPGA